MAGSVIISPQNVWTVGTHAFLPIVEMLRLANVQDAVDNDELEAIFSPLDQGFDYIAVAELSAPMFQRFVSICEKLHQTNLDDTSVDNSRKGVIDTCLSDLLAQLKNDPRYAP